MVPGRGLNTPVVFTLEDLKQVYDRDAYGTKGMWAFHHEYHAGHIQCSRLANEHCDWVMGILWNNYGAGMEWMVGESTDKDGPIRPKDVNVLKENSDVVMIFTGDYHPYKEHWEKIKREFDEIYPQDFLISEGLDDKELYSALLYSVAIRILLHDIYNMHLDYHPSCGRNRWRHRYAEWMKERFGLYQDLQDALRDEYGNVISSSKNRIPKEYTDRIKKPLLLPHFENIEELNEYIKDIADLKAVTFAKGYGWINVRFQFGNDDTYWWAEGLKLWK